ncbi:MAG: carboxylesterase family protein [Myxococcales bacterium]|nr:carboxylesterase family protein [Myxococcales bacterium]
MTRVVFTLFALSSLLMGCLRRPPAMAVPDALGVVTTEQGVIQGRGEVPYVAFRGIPFAAPPLGERRFAPPEPVAPHEGVLDAQQLRSPCLQRPGIIADGRGQEDCLYLNVFRPRRKGTFPVMVWIHGGGFVIGSPKRYDPAALVAEHDVVVVTTSYRLGILGFLAHPELADANGDSGNYGLMDQQAALRWVQRNIAGFGGDPSNVTLFGESAGGLSVLSHLVSPGSEGLFHRAIVQSGAYSLQTPTREEAEAMGAELAAALDCADAACLRSRSERQIRRAQRGDRFFRPTLHSSVLPRSLGDAVADGAFHRVPVLIGTTLDEWRLFVALRRGLLGRRPHPRHVRAEIEDTFPREELGPDVVDTIASAYPLADYGEGKDGLSYTLGALGTDAIFTCPSLRLVAGFAAHTDTYVYEFADRDSPSLLPISMGFELGAAHAFELQYLFASRAERAKRMTPESLALADAMTDYWAAFARSGDPNTTRGELPAWPLAGAGGLSLDTPSSRPLQLEDLATAHRCQLWETLEDRARL